MEHINCNCEECVYSRNYKEVCSCCGIPIESYEESKDKEEENL